MGSHSVEPQSAPLTRRRLREAERTTDATSELPTGSTTPVPSSPAPTAGRPTPTVAPQDDANPAPGDATPPARTGRRAAATTPAPAARPSMPAALGEPAPSSGAPTSRRAARATQPSAETAVTPAPVRRARPRAQSSVALPVLSEQVVPSATTAPVAQTEPSAVRPTSFLITHPARVAQVEPEPVTVVEPAVRPGRVVRTTGPADETAIVPAIRMDETTPWELADTGEVATTQDPVAHAVSTRHSGRRTRVAARLGVLGVLAGITVIVPVSQGIVPAPAAYGSDALADSTLPSTVTALSGSQLSDLPPASLVSADGALAAREVSTGASRNDIRSSLPGCDGSVRDAGQNGQLKQADLCTLWDNHTQLRADAAVSLADFNQAFAARFGADLCLSSGYRTLAEQRAVKAQKGGLAAAPGKSNHGWGLAVDLCQDQTSGAKWAWLNENGPAYGWANPAWALPGGSGPHEKWHWEYVKGVQADGEYYDG